MAAAKDYINEIKKDLKNLKTAYAKEGSTYSLIVSISEMSFDLLRVVEVSQNTDFHKKALNLNKEGNEFRRKLMSEIPQEDLLVLSRHGNTDADWILAHKFGKQKSKEFDNGDDKTRQKIWQLYMHHLDRGVFVYNMQASTAQRMIFFADQLANGLEPDFENAIFHLELAISMGTELEAGEAHYNLWGIYLNEVNNKKKAKKHLLASVDLKFPESLAAYGGAHWGDWLVKVDERKAFTLIQKASKFGSDWGTELLAISYDLGLGTRKNTSKAFKLRKSLGEDYAHKICYELAEHYLDGKGVSKDFDEGLRLLRKAMKMGSGDAHSVMSGLLMFDHLIQGDKIKADPIKRFKVLKKSVELDEPYLLTFCLLGECYLHGDGVKQNFTKAKEIFTRLLEIGGTSQDRISALWHLEALDYHDPVEALDFVMNKSSAAEGNAQGQYDLGVHYYEGKIIPRDNKEAVKWFKLAAKQGHPNAQAMLGEMYLNGHGTRKSYKEALKWYHLASQIGEATSNHNLGFMYETGLGVDRDNETAFEFYTIAAKQGIARSQNRLGAAHGTGEVLSQDDKLAIKWYQLAANQGDAMGQNNLGVMYDQGLGVRKSLKKAFELYQLSAEQDYSPAQRHLGMMYQYGEGIPKSSEKAIEWYRRAAKKGYHYAQYNLGFFYKEGDHLAQSNLNAYVCFYLAQGDGSGWSEELSTQYFNISCKQVEHANEEILELEKSMKKSEITKAKALAEKCIMSAYQTWIW